VDTYWTRRRGAWGPSLGCATAKEVSPKWNDISKFLADMWHRRISKKSVDGIDGILFYQLIEKKMYYPSLRDEEAINIDGSHLR
jgi:hypothetical protein